MAASKKLEIIYHDGKPDGIRSIRRHLSTITAYVIPRPLLAEAKKITGIGRAGIYYLISEEEDGRVSRLYVGQTRNGVFRLDDHNRSKDFWTKAILFLSDAKTFTLDMISGLEEYAIERAKSIHRYRVENVVDPKYRIDEYDLPFIEEVYEEIVFLMATQGFRLDDAEQSATRIFHTTRNGIEARGIYDGDKFQVLAGSHIDMKRKIYNKNADRRREEMVLRGEIVEENGVYVLRNTVEFRTPSGAADFVLGGSVNGWVEWKTEGGVSLDAVFRIGE